jgi:hypothetical protein
MGSYTGTGKYVAIVSEDANFFEIDNFEIDYAPQACNPPSNIVLKTYDDLWAYPGMKTMQPTSAGKLHTDSAGFDITAGDWTYIMMYLPILQESRAYSQARTMISMYARFVR